MRKKIATILIALVIATSALAMIPSVRMQSEGGSSGTNTPPTVVCIPWAIVGGTEYPHFILPGSIHTLKAVAKDLDSDMLTYRWDFESDGFWDVTGTISNPGPSDPNNPYNIEARKMYTGSDWQIIYATVEVDDGHGGVASDTYYIAIRDPTNIEEREDVQINMAIDQGLWYLHKTQKVYESGGILYGYWANYVGLYGTTFYSSPISMAVLSFENNGHLPGGDVSKDPYVETVRRGFNYLFTTLYKQTGISSPHGNPDMNSNGYAIGPTGGIGPHTRPVYEVGMVMMAVVASGEPDRTAITGPAGVIGRLYKDILQDMVDYVAWAQTDSWAGRGGWRYHPNYPESDNSVSQWPPLGLEAAEHWAASGIVVPQWVKNELALWATYVQYDYPSEGSWVHQPNGYWYSGGYYDGGSGYNRPWYYVNVAKTGALVAQLAYLDETLYASRISRAFGFLNRDWSNVGFPGSYNENFGNLYAMYAVMKGCRIADVDYIGSHDWYDEYSDYLVAYQYSDGHWVEGAYLSQYVSDQLATAWGILILTPSVFTPPPVAVAKATLADSYEGLPVLSDGSGSYHLDPNKYIAKYEFDFNDDGTYDYYEEWNDLDGDRIVNPGEFYAPDGAFDGKTESAFFNDDFTGYWRLRVSDNSVPPMDDEAVADVIIFNVDPTAKIKSAVVDCKIGLRVAGSKWSNVNLTLYENNNAIGMLEVERWPGSPGNNPSIGVLPTILDLTKSYNAVVTYDPYPDSGDPIMGDQPNNGKDPHDNAGNPVWLTLKCEDSDEKKIHHTFNTQQSMIRNSTHWNHIEPWTVVINPYVVGNSFTVVGSSTDPGSDDVTFKWTYGAQSATTTYLNNPPATDPYYSPYTGTAPVTLTDSVTFVYTGPGTITLETRDDDESRPTDIPGGNSDSFTLA